MLVFPAFVDLPVKDGNDYRWQRVAAGLGCRRCFACKKLVYLKEYRYGVSLVLCAG